MAEQSFTDFFLFAAPSEKTVQIYVDDIEYWDVKADGWFEVPVFSIGGTAKEAKWPDVIAGGTGAGYWYASPKSSKLAAPFLLREDLALQLCQETLSGFTIVPVEFGKIKPKRLQSNTPPRYTLLALTNSAVVKDWFGWSFSDGVQKLLGTFQPDDHAILRMGRKDSPIRNITVSSLEGEKGADIFSIEGVTHMGDKIACSPNFISALQKMKIQGLAFCSIHDPNQTSTAITEADFSKIKQEAVSFKIPKELKKFFSSSTHPRSSFRLPCRNTALDEEWFTVENLCPPSIKNFGNWEGLESSLKIGETADGEEYLIDVSDENEPLFLFRPSTGELLETGISLEEFLNAAT